MHRIIALISLSLGVIVLAVAPAHSQAKDSTALADSAKAKTKPDLGPTRRIEFETDEGTWMSVDVSPDGKTLLFDLLGDLYTLPITGGDAKLLMGGRAWDHMSRFSRDGKSIAFISDRDGNMNLWVANADGTNATQVTKESRSPVTSPTWSPDGTILVRKEVKWGTEELWAFYQEGGTGYKIPISGRIFGPTVSPDGRFLFVSGMRRFDRITGDSIELGSGVRPKVSPDGRFLAYALENDHLTALHLRDLKTGLDRRLVSAITPMAQERRAAQDRLPDYAFTPDGRSIVLSIGGKLARVSVATGEVATIPFRARVSQEVSQPITRSRRVPDGDLQVRVIRWPLFSRDLKRVVFGALGKVYVAELPEGKARRITNATEREYTPAFSPDGRWIAYTTWNDTTLGHVLVVPAAGGKPRRLTTLAGRYVNPVWSRDGRKLAFLRGGGVEQRGGQPESETYLDMLWLPIEGGEPRFITSMSSTSSMRYYPVIAFNPDGTRVFYSQRIEIGRAHV